MWTKGLQKKANKNHYTPVKYIWKQIGNLSTVTMPWLLQAFLTFGSSSFACLWLVLDSLPEQHHLPSTLRGKHHPEQCFVVLRLVQGLIVYTVIVARSKVHTKLWAMCISALLTSNKQWGWTLTLGLALGFSCSNFFAAASIDAAAPKSSVSAMTVGSSGSTHSVPEINGDRDNNFSVTVSCHSNGGTAITPQVSNTECTSQKADFSAIMAWNQWFMSQKKL